MTGPARCPRCGCRADATSELTLHLTPAARRRLLEHADVARRELGIRTDSEAVAEAASRLARQLVLGPPPAG